MNTHIEVEADRHKHNHCHCEPGHEVQVVVDGERHKIKVGSYLVSEFKKLMGIGEDKELDVVEKCEFRPLCDSEHIEIDGCMVFVSHVKVGCSS